MNWNDFKKTSWRLTEDSTFREVVCKSSVSQTLILYLSHSYKSESVRRGGTYFSFLKFQNPPFPFLQRRQSTSLIRTIEEDHRKWLLQVPPRKGLLQSPRKSFAALNCVLWFAIWIVYSIYWHIDCKIQFLHLRACILIHPLMERNVL